MDSERSRKRKMENEEKEESEEEKINKFFDLIKTSREAHERLLHGGAGAGASTIRKKVVEEGGKQVAGEGVWNPSFKLEDFMKEPAPAAPANQTEPQPSKSESKKMDEDEDKGIDLNLSL